MFGIIAAQSLVNLADPNGYLLFITISVLVSLSFAPILLSISPVPAFERTKPMNLIELFRSSPLGMVGTFFLGGIFGALFAMSAVFATEKGLSLSELSLFIAAIYTGGLLLQFPIGYVSDHMDRRLLIMLVTGFGAIFIVLGLPFVGDFRVLLAVGFVAGAVSNPLYSLLIAYTNDYLNHEDMASASADTYFLFVAGLLGTIAVYAAFRMTQRATPELEDTGAYTALAPQASLVAVELAQEIAIDAAIEAEESDTSEEDEPIDKI